MKKVKMAVMLAIIFIMAMSFVGCGFDTNAGAIKGELTKLVAPTNVRVEDDIIKWSSVANAGSYIVQKIGRAHV